MAPKRKSERKTGIHTLDDTPPSKKAKTTQSTPKANGLHTLADSSAVPKAQPSKVASKKGVHTLANGNVSLGSAKPSRGGRSHSTDDEDDGDYVEDGATLQSDDDDLDAELSKDAPRAKGSNNIRDASENRIDTEGLKLETRSQSKAAIRHEEATRAKLMFLERLSRGTEKTRDNGDEE